MSSHEIVKFYHPLPSLTSVYIIVLFIVNITAVINLLNGSEIAVRLLSQILQLPGPSSTTTIEPSRFPSPDDEATTAELSSDTIALIVVLILLTTLLVLIALTGVGIFIRRRRKR